MAREDIIVMSQEELKRLHLICKVIEKELKQVEIVLALGLSDRQVRRIVKRVREEGEKGVVHRLRGKPSGRAAPKERRNRVIKLYRDKYKGFGPTLASEKLLEIDKVRISDESLRKWLIAEGLWQVSRKRRSHCQWRERKHHWGEMIQIDGSHHNWFEGRGGPCVLMGYIDDATNKALARFYEYEGTFPAMDSFKRYVKKYGVPATIYLDKHSTYKSTAKPSIEDELNAREPLSQFERAVKELGVEFIHANSPQAKGRIERLFKTLQDRLIKEMRLKGIKSIEEGNRFLTYYLPIFNRRFSREPIETGNFHRSLAKGINLDKVLCIKTERVLRNDFTIVHNKRLYQVKDYTRTKSVTVEETINGRMYIVSKGNKLRYKEITQPVVKEKPKGLDLFKFRKPYIPAKDHPWRKFKIKPSTQSYIYSGK